MQHRTKLLSIILLPLFVAACHPGLTPADPQAAVALKADGVVIRVNEFQGALIQYCGPGPQCAPNTVDTNTFRELLQACIDLRAVLKTTPQGWQASAKAIWGRVSNNPRVLPLKTNPAISAAFSAVDAILGGL